MKFIKYKQVARITLYGFDDLNRNNNSSVFTEPLNSFRFLNNTVGNNAKRMRFQIKGLDNVKLSENARFCIESINVPIIYDTNDDRKSIGQTIVRMSNLSSINCFDSHGNGQTDPVIYTAHPEILYNFPISSNFLNNRYFDFILIMQFLTGDFIELPNDQRYFDLFHISFIIYDLDEQELLLTSTQDVDFKKLGETLPRKINNVR